MRNSRQKRYRAYQHGKYDYAKGQPFSQNPYSESTDLKNWNEWNKGWLDAEKESRA
jgi:hypothetical protein